MSSGATSDNTLTSLSLLLDTLKEEGVKEVDIQTMQGRKHKFFKAEWEDVSVG